MQLILTRRFLWLFAALSGALTLVIAIFLYISSPVYLRIAVGPLTGPDANIFRSLDGLLARTRAEVRLVPVYTKGLHENHEQLEKGNVDLAIIRVTDALPEKAGVIARLRIDTVYALAPGKKNIQKLSDLRNKNVAFVPRTTLDELSIRRIFEQVGIQPSEVKLSSASIGRIREAVAKGEIDCVIIIGVATDPSLTRLMSAMYFDKQPPQLISIGLGGKFIEKETEDETYVTIPPNAFPRFQIPPKETETVGFNTFLAGKIRDVDPLRQKIANDAITELSKILLERHNELGRTIRLANFIEAPDPASDPRFPIHPGTSVYLNEAATGWYDLFSEQIWTIMLIMGFFSSVLSAGIGYIKRDAPDSLDSIIERLNSIMADANDPSGGKTQMDFLTEINSIALEASDIAYRSKLGHAELARVQFALENVRQTIALISAQK